MLERERSGVQDGRVDMSRLMAMSFRHTDEETSELPEDEEMDVRGRSTGGGLGDGWERYMGRSVRVHVDGR